MGENESEESDAEFDEGFKIPGFLWKKLFKYGLHNERIESISRVFLHMRIQWEILTVYRNVMSPESWAVKEGRGEVL